ncbi:hypothetical protein [Prevotella melaninogenica]|uniref:Uncharacterized protein n=1 Tax=Prevotella melaninogenica DNF00666 TaxID=1401073 RepID=A0A096CDT5_9BACT|nr:hypothetical protein [Prevotella melaninogenica]KGF43399.1 hypothetical protein HMPREF0661_12280 [Prevotella melaninogenica DNF00666]
MARQVTLFRIQTLPYMALSFTANVLNNKRKVGHACNKPIQLRKGHEKVCLPCRKDEWADEDGGYRLTTFLPPMM